MNEIILTPQLLAKWYVLGVMSLIPLVNPIGVVPVFLSLTGGMPAEERNRQAIRAAIYSAVMMEGTFLLGAGVLTFFNISVPALRVAGGLVVAYLGFHMLFPPETRGPDGVDMQSHTGGKDFSLVPVAFPSLCGAGAIALAISYSSTIQSKIPDLTVKLAAHATGLAAILTVALLSGLLLRSASVVAGLMGEKGMLAVARIMGLLMVCIGVQFIADGVREFASMPL